MQQQQPIGKLTQLWQHLLAHGLEVPPADKRYKGPSDINESRRTQERLLRKILTKAEEVEALNNGSNSQGADRLESVFGWLATNTPSLDTWQNLQEWWNDLIQMTKLVVQCVNLRFEFVRHENYERDRFREHNETKRADLLKQFPFLLESQVEQSVSWYSVAEEHGLDSNRSVRANKLWQHLLAHGLEVPPADKRYKGPSDINESRRTQERLLRKILTKAEEVEALNNGSNSQGADRLESVVGWLAMHTPSLDTWQNLQEWWNDLIQMAKLVVQCVNLRFEFVRHEKYNTKHDQHNNSPS